MWLPKSCWTDIQGFLVTDMDCCHISGVWPVTPPHGDHHCGELGAPGTQVCPPGVHCQWSGQSYTEAGDWESDIARGCDWDCLTSELQTWALLWPVKLTECDEEYLSGGLNYKFEVVPRASGGRLSACFSLSLGGSLFMSLGQDSSPDWVWTCQCTMSRLHMLHPASLSALWASMCPHTALHYGPALAWLCVTQMWLTRTRQSPEVSLPSHQSLVFTPRLCFIDAG